MSTARENNLRWLRNQGLLPEWIRLCTVAIQCHFLVRLYTVTVGAVFQERVDRVAAWD